MALATDITIDNLNDLFINTSTGDFEVGYSDDNHVSDIINSAPGYWKQFPLLGANLFYYLNSSGKQQELKNKISTQLIADGYKINDIYFTTDQDGNLVINPDVSRI